MAGTPGVAAKMFGALSSAGVNVRAIAQGASERNISAMIDARDLTRALRSVHASFYLSAHTISIGVIGPGLVGSALVEQLASQAARLRETFEPRPPAPRRAGLAADAAGRTARRRSRDWQAERSPSGEPARPRALRRARRRRSPAARGDRRLHGQRRGRRELSGVAGRRHPRRHAEQARQQRRADAATTRSARARRQSGAHYLYEATVGAGLPIDPDAARPARDRRRHPPHRGHPLGHAVVSLQRLGRPSSRSPRCFSTRDGRALPSPIRATTSRAWTSGAS